MNDLVSIGKMYACSLALVNFIARTRARTISPIISSEVWIAKNITSNGWRTVPTIAIAMANELLVRVYFPLHLQLCLAGYILFVPSVRRIHSFCYSFAMKLRHIYANTMHNFTATQLNLFWFWLFSTSSSSSSMLVDLTFFVGLGFMVALTRAGLIYIHNKNISLLLL